MLRFIALVLVLVLVPGAWGCGRKAAPRLPEGEKLKITQKGGLDTLSVYSPYEEELEQQQEAGADLDAGIEDDEAVDTRGIPEPRRRGPRKDSWVRLDKPGAGERPRPIRDAVERVQEAVEDTSRPDRALPDTEQDFAPTDRGGLPPSPGGTQEGGF